jgi:hypothetical protein
MILQGGITAWQASAGALFCGISVPGKAFGEFVEKTWATPAMTAAAVSAVSAAARICLASLRGTTCAVGGCAQTANDRQRVIVEAMCLVYFPGLALQAGLIP